MSSSFCFWCRWAKWACWVNLRLYLFASGFNQRNEGGRWVQDSFCYPRSSGASPQFFCERILLWVIVVWSENTCTFSGKWNASRVVPILYGWVYKTLRLTIITAEESLVVVMVCYHLGWPSSIPMGSQFSSPFLHNLCWEAVGPWNLWS